MATTLKSSALHGKQGVCRVEISLVEYSVLQPWQRNPQTKATGTAFVIEEYHRNGTNESKLPTTFSGHPFGLLTNAHVVKLATDIRVRPHRPTRSFPAKVVVYAPNVDLALLEILGSNQASDFARAVGGAGGCRLQKD